MKYVIYVRISKPKRDRDGKIIEDPCALETQVNGCLQHIPKDAKYTVFEENGLTADLPFDERPILWEALCALDKGDVLLTYKNDRLHRGGTEGALLRHHIENKIKARVESATEPFIGADDPMSQLMSDIVAVFARYELLLIRWRTKGALRTMKKRGQRTGHIPYGSKLEEGNMLARNPGEQAVLEKMVRYSDEGLSLREVCARLNDEGHLTRKGTEWSFSFVGQLIKKQKVAKSLTIQEPQFQFAELRCKA